MFSPPPPPLKKKEKEITAALYLYLPITHNLFTSIFLRGDWYRDV